MVAFWWLHVSRVIQTAIVRESDAQPSLLETCQVNKQLEFLGQLHCVPDLGQWDTLDLLHDDELSAYRM